MAKKKKAVKAQAVFKIFAESKLDLEGGQVIHPGKANVCYTTTPEIAREAQAKGAHLQVVDKIPSGYEEKQGIFVKIPNTDKAPDDSELEGESLTDSPAQPDTTLEEVTTVEDEPDRPEIDIANLTPEQIAALREKLGGA